MLDFLKQILGLEDKARFVLFIAVSIVVFIVGFILGSWMGNPNVYIYTQDGKKTEVKWEGQPKDLPQIIREGYEEGASSPL